MYIYLTNIQGLSCAKNKDPLCIPRTEGRVNYLPVLLVQELIVLNYDLIVLPFLQTEVLDALAEKS